MEDIILCEKINEFSKLTNRKYTNDDDTYEVDLKKCKYAFKMIEYLAEMFPLSFHGCSIIPSGSDGIVKVRTDLIGIENPFEFQNIFSKVDSIKIIPLEEHFVIELLIKDMYRLCDDDEFENI